jgi:hypothetical protein
VPRLDVGIADDSVGIAQFLREVPWVAYDDVLGMVPGDERFCAGSGRGMVTGGLKRERAAIRLYALTGRDSRLMKSGSF